MYRLIQVNPDLPISRIEKISLVCYPFDPHISVGFREYFVEIHSYETSAKRESNVESILQRFMNLQGLMNLEWRNRQ